METAFSLGSNLGDRFAILTAARDRIVQTDSVRSSWCSAIYETEPVGVKPEYADKAFLNAVVIVEAERGAEAWHRITGGIEDEFGRTRTGDRYAPRPLDIDLIYSGNRAVSGRGLTVPHPRWMERRFVLQPLADLRPNLQLPGTDGTISEILAGLPPGEEVSLFAKDW